MASKITPKKNKVTGTKKKDKITWVSSSAWKKALTVNAGAGNDIINFKKSKYKNKLNGQAGNDTIYGGTKNDTIHGNAGTDKLYGYNGNDKIYGDAGKDKIYGGNGNDILYGGKDNDYIDGGANNDKIYGQYGTNTLKGGAGKDSIYGGTGKDIIYAGSGDDYVSGGNGNDDIYGNSGNNKLYGGAGKDTITGGTGNDFIDGGADSDVIMATAGTNTIIGGAGDDVINSGTGVDTFRFASGSGHDDIYGATSLDKIEFTGTVDELTYEKVDDDLVITRTTGTVVDTVTLKFYFSSEDRLNTIVSNGENTDINEIMVNITGSGTINGTEYNDVITGSTGNDVITGNAGNDIINPGGGNNNLIFNMGDGEDTVNSGTGTDTISFNTSQKNTYYQEKVDNNLVIHYTTNDKITLTDFFNDNHSAKYIKFLNQSEPTLITDEFIYISGAGSITGTKYIDYIYGSDGADEITAGQVHYDADDCYDYLDSSYGEDVINVQQNGKLYMANWHWDNMTINGAAAAKSIIIETTPDVYLLYGYQNGENYVIVKKDVVWVNAVKTVRTQETTLTNFTLSNHPDVITMDYVNYEGLSHYHLDDVTSETNIVSDFGNDQTELDISSDNPYILGGINNDVITLKGTNGNATIAGRDGDDIINVSAVGAGSTLTINHKEWDGADIIRGLTANGSYDFNVNQDFIVRHNSQNARNLEIVPINNRELNEDNKITIENYWNENYASEGDIVNSNIKINGTNIHTDDVLNFASAVITNNYNTLVSGTAESEYIFGRDGNDSITTGGGNDIIYSGTGNDTINLDGDGAVTAYHNAGDGNLYIRNIRKNRSIDLYLEDIDKNKFTVEKQGNDLKLVHTNGEIITFESVFVPAGSFGAGYFINLYSKDKTFIGEIRNYLSSENVAVNVYPNAVGKLVGASSARKNIFHPASSTNEITIYNSANGDNEIVSPSFSNLNMTWCNNPGVSKYEREENNLKITGVRNVGYSGEGGIWADENTIVTVIDNYFAAAGDLTHNIVYLNNVTIELNYDGEILSTVIDRSENDDSTLKGTNLNDTIIGGTRDGRLDFDGGKGNDLITGRQGKVDAFTFYKGDGQDTIYSGNLSGGEEDKIFIYGYSSPSVSSFSDWEYEFTGEGGNDLTIKYNHVDNVAQDSVTIKNYLKEGVIDSSIKYAYVGNENYTGQVGDLFTKVLGKKITSSGTATTVNGTFFDDSIIGYQNDTVYGGEGNDTIYYGNSTSAPVTIDGGAGDDSITGSFNKNDSLMGGAGNDYINGRSGNNTIKGGDGNDSITSQSGNDSIFGGAGDDSIDTGAGNDTIYTDNGDDIVIGGTGDDEIYAENGSNTLKFASGDGNDIVYASSTSFNTIKFTDINFSDITTFYYDSIMNPKSFEIYYGATDRIHIRNFNNGGNMWVEDKDNVKRGMFLRTSAGNYYSIQSSLDDYIFGSTGNDTLRGSWGNDTIKGSTGNDTFVFNKMVNAGAGQFDGHDVIYCAVGNSYSSTLIFGEIENNSYTNMINYSDMDFIIDNNDLLIKYDYYNEDYLSSVRLIDYVHSYNSIKNIKAGVDGVATDKTLYEVLAGKHIYISTDNIEASNGNDTITALSGCTYVFGRDGNDIITSRAGNISIYTYMNVLNTQGIDTTEGTVDTVIANGSTNTIYAQSETNIISSTTATSNDIYYAHLSQKTEITDNGGTDSLKLRNSYLISDTDGTKDNAHLLFNVASDYDYDSTDASTLFTGDILITNAATKATYDLWQGNGAYTGVSIKNNALETINSSDSYSLTKGNISELAQAVANWLGTNGYSDVAEVFSTADNDTDIAALIAQFDNANWQASV